MTAGGSRPGRHHRSPRPRWRRRGSRLHRHWRQRPRRQPVPDGRAVQHISPRLQGFRHRRRRPRLHWLHGQHRLSRRYLQLDFRSSRFVLRTGRSQASMGWRPLLHPFASTPPHSQGLAVCAAPRPCRPQSKRSRRWRSGLSGLARTTSARHRRANTEGRAGIPYPHSPVLRGVVRHARTSAQPLVESGLRLLRLRLLQQPRDQLNGDQAPL